MQTADTIDAQLAGYRDKGDAQLPECPLVTSAFRSIPPHRVGVAHLLLRPRFHLWDPTGTGKTPQTLVAYGYLRHTVPAMRLLVLGRKSSLPQWRAQVARFLRHDIRAEIVGYNPENLADEWRQSQRADQYARWLRGDVDVLIGTYTTLAKDWTVEGKQTSDGLPKAGGKRKVRRQWGFAPEGLPQYTVIFDEEHNIRGHKGDVVYPAMELISQRARCAWGLTATPFFHRLDDLYGVVELVRPGTLSPYTDFANQYLKRFLMRSPKHRRSFWKVTGTKNVEILVARLRPYFLQRPIATFDQYLPDVTTQVVMVDMGAKQTKLYNRIRKDSYPQPQHVETKTAETIARRIVAQAEAAAARTDDTDPLAPVPSPFTIQQKMTALLYAQLALDAPVVLGVVDTPSAKLDELLARLRDEWHDDSVLIYTRFEQVATVLHEAINGDERAGAAGRITGKETGAQRRQAQDAFQSGTLRRMIITSAGGEALDLQAARVLVLYDLPYSWGELAQIIGRARRTGSAHRSILLLLLGTTHTIEPRCLDLLQKQESLVASTFNLSEVLLKSTTQSERNASHSVSAGVLSGDFFTSSDVVSDLFARLYEDVSPSETVL